MKKVNIIGAGISGLVTGIYLRKKGYEVYIYEKKPCSGGRILNDGSRKFKGIALNQYIRGIQDDSEYNKILEELGINTDILEKMNYFKKIVFENGDEITIPLGKIRLERFLMSLSLGDIKKVKSLFDDLEYVDEYRYLQTKTKPRQLWVKSDYIKFYMLNRKLLKKIRYYEKKEVEVYLDSLESRKLREVIRVLTNKKASMLYLLDNILELSKDDYAQINGGIEVLINSLENKFLELKGKIVFNSDVKRILVENNKNKILLKNGEKKEADIVICSVDGFYSLVHLLGEKNINKDFDKLFLDGDLFDSYVIVVLLVDKKIKTNCKFVRHILKKPFIDPTGAFHKKFDMYISEKDDKTIISVYIRGNYDYWKKSYKSKVSDYNLNKILIGRRITEELIKRGYNIEEKIEKLEVITPYEYYKENNVWRGVGRGWIPTPKFYNKIFKNTLSNAEGIYFCGQWINIGADISKIIKNSKELANIIYEKDNIK